MPEDENIKLLLAKLPVDSLARKLVEPFAERAHEAATKIAQDVLAAVRAAHLVTSDDDPA